MIYDVITRTGAIYRIDLEDGFWSKHRYFEYADNQLIASAEIHMEKIWSMMVGTTLTHPWNDPENWYSTRIPEVGKHLHLGAKNIWYTSTEVTHVVEVDGWDPVEFPITNPKDLEEVAN